MAKSAVKTHSVALLPVADLDDYWSCGELVAWSLGPDGVAYFLVALKSVDYRHVDASGASFAKTIPAQPQDYRVIGLSDDKIVLDVTIRGEEFNIHDLQPLAGSELLLVCGRSHYRGPDDFEKNGRIYSLDGTFLREILLGDGVQSVQATSAGVIWTSYFDEGIFGNFGWSDPIGAPGLVAWDGNGEKLYQFNPTAGLDAMCDCYALNVASESVVWCYYYTEFPLVRIRRRRIDGIWKCPVSGSHAFAIGGKYALFQGGYDQHEKFPLLDISKEGKAVSLAKVRFTDEDGEVLVAEQVIGRGSALHLLRGSKLYRADVATVANLMGV